MQDEDKKAIDLACRKSADESEVCQIELGRDGLMIGLVSRQERLARLPLLPRVYADLPAAN
jgi:hypothetical protein